VETAEWLDPQANFFHIYAWLVIIYGYFSAKPENRHCQINFGPENCSSYQIYFIPKTSPEPRLLLVMQRRRRRRR